MEINEIQNYLSNIAKNCSREDLRKDGEIEQQLAAMKIQSVAVGDQLSAKSIWCLEVILRIQSSYILAFENLKQNNFYEAWCIFERIETNLHFLRRHFSAQNDVYKLDFIEKHIKQYQSLFPYKIFFSPGILILEAECSICGQRTSIRNPCHFLGEIYNGEMCSRIITNAKLLEGSVVMNPVQKYSVIFPIDSDTGERVDHYNYSIVKFVIDALESPFDEWDTKETQKRQPHSRFKNIGRNGKCPCDSGEKYKNCCLKKSGVLRPHLELMLSVAPSRDLSDTVYFD
jgi:hypothetical protein